MPRSLIGFAEQSLYVGYALMCRAFTNMWYTTQFDEFKISNYSRSCDPSMTPERKLIYKVFCLLDTHTNKGRSPFRAGYVQSVESNLGIELKRVKLERIMHNAPTSADGILISLDQLYSEAIKGKAVSAQEEVEDATDDAEDEEEEALACASQMREAIMRKTEVCAFLGEDLVLKERITAMVICRETSLVALVRVEN